MASSWTITPVDARAAAVLAREIGVSEVTASVLARRGYTDPEAARRLLAAELPDHDPFLLGDMATAAMTAHRRRSPMSRSLDTLSRMLAANYRSGDDFVVEFLGHRFEFSATDFEERVIAAAVRLELLASNDVDEQESADLVELVADGRIEDPRSGLGLYLVRHWERVSLQNGESLVYWLRKLVFRGAWLDHRVKEGLLDVSWLDDTGDFGYAEPQGGRTLLELAPVPSWNELQYRG